MHGWPEIEVFGAVEGKLGVLRLEKGFVVLTDASGAPLSDEKHRIKLGPGDDATVLAKRLLEGE